MTFVVKVPGWPLPETNTKSASGNCPSQAKGAEWPSRWGSRAHHCPIHPHIYTNGCGLPPEEPSDPKRDRVSRRGSRSLVWYHCGWQAHLSLDHLRRLVPGAGC